jgi:uncharacterized repeat protein (TIGR02543 family)
MQTLYELAAAASPASGGTITLPRADGVDSFGNPFFKANSAVSISETANSGYNFTGWTGPVAAASNSTTTVTMTGPVTVTANFVSTGPATGPTVVSFNVLFGSQSYNVIGSSRVRLPWQIRGIRVEFSEPITSGDSASLSGAAATGISGLGTNTLTWTISPIAIGNVSIVLSGSGAHALKDAGGNALKSGAGFTQALKILWGDFNDDGAVSASDLVLVNKAISQPYNVFADMNGDGLVSLPDVQTVFVRIRMSRSTHSPSALRPPG